MQIKFGTSRIVLLIPQLGVALKFPRLYIREMLVEVYFGYLKRRRFKELWSFMKASPDTIGSFRYLIFHGLLCNLSEFWFYVKTRNTLAWPTYFSFFGICNIQKLGKIPPFDEAWFIYNLILSIGRGDIRDNHCFSNVSNFTISKDDGLYFLDYASPNCQLVMQKYEDELRRKFGNYVSEMTLRERQREAVGNPLY